MPGHSFFVALFPDWVKSHPISLTATCKTEYLEEREGVNGMLQDQKAVQISQNSPTFGTLLEQKRGTKGTGNI